MHASNPDTSLLNNTTSCNSWLLPLPPQSTHKKRQKKKKTHRATRSFALSKLPPPTEGVSSWVKYTRFRASSRGSSKGKFGIPTIKGPFVSSLEFCYCNVGTSGQDTPRPLVDPLTE